MTEIAGRNIKLLYHPDGDFQTAGEAIARARTKALKVDREFIDITSDSSGPNRELMNMVGQATSEITLACVTQGSAQHRTLVGLCMGTADGSQLHAFEIDAAGLGVFTATWFISSFSLGADYGPEVSTLEITLVNSGAVSFVAATDPPPPSE